jgi:predicted dehydrogenase
VQKAKAVLRNVVGPIVANYTVNAGFIPKDSWIQDPKEGGGRIIGEVCHFVDTLRYLTESPVKTVQAASIQTDHASQTSRDSVAITLTYADGSLGTIAYHALGNANYPKERIEVAAGGTTVVIDDFRRLDVYGKKKESVKSTQDKGFDVEIKAFVDTLANGGPAPIPIDEIIETTLVTFAIHQALNTGTVVHLEDFARDKGI